MTTGIPICLSSINEQIGAHGIPSANVILQDGDILTIDTGATSNG